MMNAWDAFVAMMIIYCTWRHVFAAGAFVLSSSPITRNICINYWIKVYAMWRYMRSLALIRVIHDPTGLTTIKLLLGSGDGSHREIVIKGEEQNATPKILLFDE